MKSWKKWIALLLTLTMITGVLAACSSSEEASGGTSIVDRLGPPPEDPQGYLEYVGKAFSTSVFDSYDRMSETGFIAGNGATIDAKMTLGDFLVSSLSQSAGMDMSFLKSVGLKFEIGKEDSLTMESLGIALNNTTIATVKMIMDQASQNIYLALPELSSQYLMLPLQAMAGGAAANPMSSLGANLTGPLEKALPTAEEAQQLLDKYIALFLGQMKNVQKATENVTLDGVTQQLNRLTVTITEADMIEASKAVLAAAKDDAAIRDILQKIDSAMAEIASDMGVAYDVSCAEEFAAAVEETLAEVESTQPTSAEELVIEIYTDDQHELSGLTVAFDGQSAFTWLTVLGSNGFRFNAEMEGASIVGTGTKSDRQFVLTVDGQQMLTVDVRDYDASKNQNGNCNLKLTIRPAQAMLAEMGYEAAAAFAQMGGDPAFAIEIASNGKTAHFAADVLAGSNSLVKLEMDVKTADFDVSAPSNAVDSTNQQALMNWAMTLDINKLLEKLEDAGVPQELLMQLMTGMMG